MEIYQKRLQIIKLIREFFWSKNFQEADTPIAVTLPGQEPYLSPMPIFFHNPHCQGRKFYLQTSPELAMKKLLAAGFKRIFQICKCFRDFESFGGYHNPEFTMIEWYRAPGRLKEIMDDTEELFKFLAKNLSLNSITRIVGEKEYTINILDNWDRLSMRQVWEKYLHIELNDYLTSEKMADLAGSLGFAITKDDQYEDLFYKIFLNKIEQKLGLERPVIIYDYPQQMTSLSRLSQDPLYAQRFELYVAGLELANAFGELTDPVEQKRRLEADKEKRAEMQKETWPVDDDFIKALESGVPEAGGIALGVDRLIMLLTNAKDINEVIFQGAGDAVFSER